MTQSVKQAVLAALMFFGIGLAIGQAQSTALRWKFDAGDSFVIHLEQSTSVESEFDLAMQKITSDSAIDCRWTVVDVNSSGTADIDMTFDSVSVKAMFPTSSGVRMLEIDSAVDGDYDAQEKEMLANLRALIGQKIRLQVTNRGQVESIQLSDQAKQVIREAPAAMQLRALLSEEGLQELLGQAVPLFPEEESVEAGFSWQTSKSFVGPTGPFTRDQRFTYVGSESFQNQNAEKIEMTANLIPVTDADSVPGDAANKMAIKDQSCAATIWFDAVDGRLLNVQSQTMLQTVTQYREKPLEIRLTSDLRMEVKQDP